MNRYKISISTLQFGPIVKRDITLTAMSSEEAHIQIEQYFSEVDDIYGTNLMRKYEAAAKRAEARGCPIVVYSHPQQGVLVRHFVEVTEMRKVFVYEQKKD